MLSSQLNNASRGNERIVLHVASPLIHLLEVHDVGGEAALELVVYVDFAHLVRRSGGKKRGFWWIVSDFEGWLHVGTRRLDADERVEVADACL